MSDPEDNDDEAVEALQKVRDDLDGLRTRLKQVPHPSAQPHGEGPAEPPDPKAGGQDSRR